MTATLTKETLATANAIDTVYSSDLAVVRRIPFDSMWEALAYVEKHKIKDWEIVKVGDKYEIH